MKHDYMYVLRVTRFGLTVHFGDKWNDGNSKTEAMYFPLSRKTATATNIGDIWTNTNEFCSYCNTFKYLGTIFTQLLKDDLDIQWWITQVYGVFATMNCVLCNRDTTAKLQIWIDHSTVINILLWSCESWALKRELRQKLEFCHHRFQRKMVTITIYKVKDHQISNKNVRDKLNNYYTFYWSLKLKSAK